MTVTMTHVRLDVTADIWVLKVPIWVLPFCIYVRSDPPPPLFFWLRVRTIPEIKSKSPRSQGGLAAHRDRGTGAGLCTYFLPTWKIPTRPVIFGYWVTHLLPTRANTSMGKYPYPHIVGCRRLPIDQLLA